MQVWNDSANSLLDTVVKNLVLLRNHWKDPIKGKSILLRPRYGLRVAHHHRLEIVIERHDDLAALSQLESIWRSKPIYICNTSDTKEPLRG